MSHDKLHRIFNITVEICEWEFSAVNVKVVLVDAQVAQMMQLILGWRAKVG